MKDIFEVLYLISTKKYKTQREVAKKMDVSLGKVNSIFKEAENKGYIVSNDTYSLSADGQKLLESHKVDNAIILAAGFGSRFVPMTYETPKGLLEVRGEIMIERQIKQLHEVGITEIVIVVGYLKETFEYLKDKYNVKLVYNPDFKEKNNISSLYYAREHFKNSYLLTSDIYMQENIYRPYEYNSFYAVEYFKDYTDEWAVDLNKDNLITKVHDEGGEDCYAMYGPVFLKESFSTKLLEEIDKIYNRKHAAQWFWEDVYMRNLQDLPLYARKYPKDLILEFESLDELRAFDDTYLTEARSDVLDTIAKVFDVSLNEIVEIKTLKEGMTNDSFLFEVKGEKYVFRNPGVGTEFLINRFEEKAVYDQILPLGISDEVVYLEPEKGYKIAKYINNSRQIDFNKDEEVEKIFEIIRNLHNSGLKVEHEFNLEEKIAWYLELCEKSNAILFNDFDKVHLMIQDIVQSLKKVEEEKVLIHADFVSINFLIDDNDHVTLLDWEYAGMGERYIDLAMNTVFEGLQDEEIEELLTRYLQREPSDLELWKLHSYIALCGFLWTLWTLYKHALGNDFGTYAMEQYAYAKKYGRIAHKEIKNYA